MTDHSDEIRGALFEATHRHTDRSPDFTGELNFPDGRIRVSAWWKTDRHGNRFLSLAARPDDRQGTDAPGKVRQWRAGPPIDGRRDWQAPLSCCGSYSPTRKP